MPRCEQCVERDSGVTCATTALVIGSQRPAPLSCAGHDAMKRECGSIGCCALSARDKNW
jgi:hypothetical protein